MIAFRHAPLGYPFIWESDQQPAARWHGAGQGPVHYFADTPDGAWAEFLRHNEITPEELPNVQRNIWAVEIKTQPVPITGVPLDKLMGSTETYPACRAAAEGFRKRGIVCFSASSAALKQGCARGWRVDNGLQPGDDRDGLVVVCLKPVPEAVGWLVGTSAPPDYILGIYVPL
jgi:hypothetical protein